MVGLPLGLRRLEHALGRVLAVLAGLVRALSSRLLSLITRLSLVPSLGACGDIGGGDKAIAKHADPSEILWATGGGSATARWPLTRPSIESFVEFSAALDVTFVVVASFMLLYQRVP